MEFVLGDHELKSDLLVKLATEPKPSVAVSDAGKKRVEKFRKVVDGILSHDKAHYGINTGFGYLANVKIEKAKLAELQVNLVRSHACGVGPVVEPKVVRALLILRAHTFLKGHSGVTPKSVETILNFLKNDVLPVIPCQGSVGASGDLAPLAHLALGLMGEGQVLYKNATKPAAEVCETLRLEPLKLSPKEGLSFINGTHFMTALGAFAVEGATALMKSADIIAAMSLDGIRGSRHVFDERIHALRPQSGQARVAAAFRRMFQGADPIMDSHKDCSKVQDPYSFRCIPQVHGASRDALAYVANVVNIELNSVTDNPLCFEDGTILSGGNFHGQPVALAMDFLTIAVSEIGSISERRTEKLTNPTMSGLPAFMAKNSGLNSGFMIPHVVAAALASENKTLCYPASVDTIPTSADQEDHVSMGPIAARKCRQVIENTAAILAIEALAACQALELLKPLEPNAILKAVYDEIRKVSPAVEQDRALNEDIEKVKQLLLSGRLLETVKKYAIDL